MLFTFFVLMQATFAVTTILWSGLYSSSYLAGMTTGYIVGNLMFTTFAAVSRGVSIFVGPLLGKNKMAKAKAMSMKLFWPNLFICFSSMAIAGIVTTFFPALMLNNKQDIFNAQWLIFTFILALPGYLWITFFSAMFEVGGLQFVPNFWNRGFPIWCQIPIIVIFSPLVINLDWKWAFLIFNLSTYLPCFVVFFSYRRFKWLRQIKSTD